MLNDVTNRSVTHDIDVFEADRCLREIIARYPEVNGMAVAYCNQMPFNYEDRLIPLDIGARFTRFLQCFQRFLSHQGVHPSVDRRLFLHRSIRTPNVGITIRKFVLGA